MLNVEKPCRRVRTSHRGVKLLRRAWCATKSRAILQQRVNLLSGAVPVVATDLAGAVTNIDKSASTLEAAMGLKAEHFEQAAVHWLAWAMAETVGQGKVLASPVRCERSPP